MVRRLLVFTLVALVGSWWFGCAVGSGTVAPSAPPLGVPASPTADLLRELTKGDPAAAPSDPKQDERNARMLPQVLANSDRAIARIQNGEDSGRVIDDLQRANAALGK